MACRTTLSLVGTAGRFARVARVTLATLCGAALAASIKTSRCMPGDLNALSIRSRALLALSLQHSDGAVT